MNVAVGFDMRTRSSKRRGETSTGGAPFVRSASSTGTASIASAPILWERADSMPLDRLLSHPQLPYQGAKEMGFSILRIIAMQS